MSTRTGSALLVLTVAAFVLLVSFASAGTAPLTTINFTPAIPPAVRFLTPTIIPISTGQVPLSIATADLNGDGNVDIALRTEQGVQILLGNGKGGFTLGAFYALKQSVQGYDAITLADMNNDGIPDIVTTSLGGPSVVYIFLGNGDGTFKTPTSYTAIEPYAVAVGDFNGDGNLDVAVAQAGNDSIGVFLGNGNGTLQPEFNYAVSGGFHAETIAIGDLNGDGKLDIVSASQFINIFFGNGDGTFQTPVVLSAGASQVAVADVNNDGQPDIVFSIGAAVGVYLNKGGGTFTNYIVSQSTGLSGGFALADFNHDGNIDVILGSNGIMFGEGNGKFRATSTLYFGNTTTRVLADVNGDGILDVLQPYSNTGSGITLTFGAGGGALDRHAFFQPRLTPSPRLWALTSTATASLTLPAPSMTSCRFSRATATAPSRARSLRPTCRLRIRSESWPETSTTTANWIWLCSGRAILSQPTFSSTSVMAMAPSNRRLRSLLRATITSLSRWLTSTRTATWTWPFSPNASTV